MMCMPMHMMLHMHHVHIIIYDGVSSVLILSLFFYNVIDAIYICISIHPIQYMYIYMYIMTLNPYLLVVLFLN